MDFHSETKAKKKPSLGEMEWAVINSTVPSALLDGNCYRVFWFPQDVPITILRKVVVKLQLVSRSSNH